MKFFRTKQKSPQQKINIEKPQENKISPNKYLLQKEMIKEEMIGSQKQNQTKMIDRYRACMVLSAVGDAMGYKNGDWEFNTSGKIIHQQMSDITNQKGIKQLKIDMSWRYSDDTVMHMATAQALIKEAKDLSKIQRVFQSIAMEYKNCGKRMSGRAPGKTCMKSINILQNDGSNWDQIPYNTRSVGCGGSMRSACIGLVYWREEQLKQLIAVSIEAGRITHHNPIGYLGSMVAAFFTSLAVRNVPIHLWVRQLLCKAIPYSQNYIKEAKRESQENLSSEYWKIFVDRWNQYADIRKLAKKVGEDFQPAFPQNYGIEQRQRFYRKITFTKWPGASGLDSTIIAYDALLGASQCQKVKWEEFCLRGILHGGDNDSTGAIGGAWFGAYYGFETVYKQNYGEVEDNLKLKKYGEDMFKMVNQ